MDNSNLIEKISHSFLVKDTIDKEERIFAYEIIPSEFVSNVSVQDYIEFVNEIISFKAGEWVKYIKEYLFTNNLFYKDNARLLKDEIIFYKKFLSFLNDSIKNIEDIDDKTKKRLLYVINKVDKYLEKYMGYTSL